MPAATDLQMQVFCDTRIRVRAEAIRDLMRLIIDDKNLIGDEYTRATSNVAWADARGDGPPHLLQSGNSANPDDLLNYNALASNLQWLLSNIGPGNDVGGTLAAFKSAVLSQLAVLSNACARGV